jgi:hypothetical protein
VFFTARRWRKWPLPDGRKCGARSLLRRCGVGRRVCRVRKPPDAPSLGRENRGHPISPRLCRNPASLPPQNPCAAPAAPVPPCAAVAWPAGRSSPARS